MYVHCRKLWEQEPSGAVAACKRVMDLEQCAEVLGQPQLKIEAQRLRIHFYHRGACLANLLEDKPSPQEEKAAQQYHERQTSR